MIKSPGARAMSENFDRLVEQEDLILSATELVCELMEEKSTSKADLARAIGRSRGYVTQILAGSRNMTLRTLADLTFAMGHRIEIDTRPLSSSNSDLIWAKVMNSAAQSLGPWVSHTMKEDLSRENIPYEYLSSKTAKVGGSSDEFSKRIQRQIAA